MAQSPSGSTMWGALTDLANNRWRLQWGGASVGIQCVRNDVVDTNTSNVARAWVSPSGYFCQENIYGGSWYYDPKLAAANKFAWVLISAPTSAPPVQQPPATTPVSTPTADAGPGARSDFITADLALAQNYKNRNSAADRRSEDVGRVDRWALATTASPASEMIGSSLKPRYSIPASGGSTEICRSAATRHTSMAT
jgi:hypothetical protein